MSKTWDIKGLRGVDDDLVTIATVHELEYHGEWMGDEYVAVDIKSAEPVELRFGDYLIYRGDKFVIDYDPSMIKKARSGSYGEAFTYDNVKLFSVARELNNIQFRDVVLNDNGVHTAMSRFQFFAASVEDLADRIQANMNRHSGGAWVVFTPNKNRWLQRKPGYIQESAWNNLYGSSDPTAIVGETDINVDCQDLTCSGALAMVYNTFKVPFVVRGHSVIIGAPAVDAGKIFKYGLGNGLYEIERTANDEQVVTMLYAYGSENNMPLNYYANIKKHMVVTGVRDSHDMGQGFVTYGLRTQVLYSSVKNALTRDDTQCILQYGNVTVKANADASLNGGESYGTQYLYFSFHSDEVDHTDEAFYNALGSGTVTVTIKSGTNINQLPDSMIAIDSAETYPTALSVNRLMLPGFPDRSLRDWVSAAARGEFIMPGYDNLNESMRIATQIATARVFSNDPLSPWIKSHFAGTFGVKEGSIYFDGSSNQKDIKPTIEGTGADIVTVGSTITDNGYLTEGTDASFEITIASNGVLDWSSAWTSHIEDVYIEMKSGFCTGRKFKLLSEPELTDSGWKMKLEREKDTSMSRYFPYHDNDVSDYAQVVSGDKFVVTGIDLPKGYVDAASVQLLIESCKALDLLDHPNRTYLPKIDEIYMQRQDDEAKASDGEITSLHDTLRAGMTLSMLDTDLEISVDSTIDVITIKENGNNGIPTYDVVLRDQKEKGLLNIVDDRIDKAVNGYPLSDMLNYGELSALFLSKQSDDTAKGLIRFIRGLQVGERFVTGLLGEGGIFRKEADGTTYIEADKLYIRMKAYFDSVEIRDYKHSAGNRIQSPAGARCCRVDWIDENGNSLKHTGENLDSTVLFRCYFRGSDGEDEVRNNFVIGDQAYCHVTTVETEDDSPQAKGLNMKHYWRLVVGRNAHGTLTDDGEHWIDLSNRLSETLVIGGTSYTRSGYQSGSDVPEAKDDIIQLGNINDTDRQGAIIEFVTGADAPSYQIFQGINSFNLNGKNYIGFGYSTQTGRAYLNVYGDTFIGAMPDEYGNSPTYLKYNAGTRSLEIKAKIDAQSTIDGETLAEFIAQNTWTEEQIDALITAGTEPLEDAIEEIQRQVDGSIATWFYDGVPTLNNPPASGWTTADLKNEHLGDLYYDNLTGYAYRFKYDDTNRQWSWGRITDVDVTKALADAAKAQDTADHKRRIFVVQPTPPYDQGDLWVNATYPSGNTETNAAQNKYYNDVLRCKTTKASGTSFAIADWGLASKYTDDQALLDFKANQYVQQLTNGTLNQGISNAQSAASQAALDAAAAQAAADDAQTDADAANDRLDDWADDGVISPTEKTSLKVDWEDMKKECVQICNDADKYSVSKTAFASAYTSANAAFQKYTASTPENITIGSDYANIAAYYAARQTIMDAISVAAKKVATDAQAAADAAGLTASSALTAAQAAEAHAATMDAVKQALNQGTLIDGGLVLSTFIGLRDANNTLWSGISGAYSTTGAYGGGLAAWFGGGHVDRRNSDGTWNNVGAKVGFRFDGSGYVAGGAISWDATGLTKVTASKISALEIDLNGDDVATESWVSSNFVSITFFERLFQAYNGSTIVHPNSTSTIDNIKAMFGFWTEQYISALGQGSGGGSGVGDVTWDLLASSSDTRQIALSHLTEALSGYATQSWVNSRISGMSTSLAGLSDVNVSGVTSGQYLKFNGQGWVPDTPSGSGGTVTAVKVGTTTYNPTSGIVSLPAYPTVPTNVSAFTNDAGYTTNIGTVTQVKVGTTAYNPSSGVVSLPAYPSYNFSGISFTSGYRYYGEHDANNITSSGVWYYSSNGPAMTLGASTNDGALYSQAYSTEWVGQIAQDYRIGRLFVRGMSGGTWTNWLRIPLYIELPTKISQLLNDSGYITSSADITGNAGSATKLQTARTIWGNLFDGTGNITGTPQLNRVSSNSWGRISFYSSTYYTWYHYMTPAGGSSPTSQAAPSGNFVTSWALRSLIENNSGYGWTWESCSNANTSIPTIKMELSSSTGALYVTGNICSVGNIGIGTTSPSYKLHVNGTFYASGNSSIGGTLGVTGAATLSSTLSVAGNMTVQSIEIGQTNEINATGASNLYLQYRNTGNLVLCHNGKNVGIGTSPSYKLHVSGDVYATGGVTCLSDIREKNILGQTKITVEQIATMRSIVYRWKDNGDDHDEHVGSIAQDWQNVLPQAVLTAKDEKKTLSMQYGVAALVSAITIARKVVDHERRIKELEDENKKLKKQLKIA